MKTTINIEIEIEEDEDVETVGDALQMLQGGDEEQMREMSEVQSLDLSEEHEYVLEALRQRRGVARKLVHREATKIDGSPFVEPESSDERERVGSLLRQLEREGFVHHEKKRWYPGPS